MESYVQAGLGPVALGVAKVQDEIGQRGGFERSQGGVLSAHRFEDFKGVFAVAVVGCIKLSQTLSFPRVEREVPGVHPRRRKLWLGGQDHIALAQQRQDRDKQGLIVALCSFDCISRPAA